MSKLASRSTWPVRGCHRLLLQEQKTLAQLTGTGKGITETGTTEEIGSGRTAQGSSIKADMHQIGIKMVRGAPAVTGTKRQTGSVAGHMSVEEKETERMKGSTHAAADISLCLLASIRHSCTWRSLMMGSADKSLAAMRRRSYMHAKPFCSAW